MRPVESERADDIPYSRPIYRTCNLVERFYNKIKEFRRIATGYDGRAVL
jgi:transposase